MSRPSFHTQIRQNFSFNTLYLLTVLAFLPILVVTSWLYWEFALKMTLLFALILAQETTFVLLKVSPGHWGHSLLTGVYLGFLLPISLPWLAFILVPFVSIGVFRLIFGVAGYWLNPALAGFLFAFTCWPSTWRDLFLPTDASSLLSSYVATHPISEIDTVTTSVLNHSPLFESLLINVPSGYINLLQGQPLYNYISPIGLFLAIILLWRRQVIKWSISVAFLLTFFPLVYLFEGSLLWDDLLFMGDSFFYFLSPIALLAIFFLSPEGQTSPLNRTEMILHGILCGLFSFAFLLIWVSPYSILFGVVTAQIVSPLFGFHKVSYFLLRRKMERSSRFISREDQKENA